MDDELQKIEDELRRRRPLPLPTELVHRIGRELAPSRRASASRWWAWSLPVGAAAAFVLGWNVKRPSAAPSEAPASTTPPPVVATATAPENVLTPVAIENVLYAARDEGVVTLSDGAPARRQRLQFLDSVTWKDQQSNVSVTWTLPREEIRVVRVIYH
jgi:hypothetical protein